MLMIILSTGNSIYIWYLEYPIYINNSDGFNYLWFIGLIMEKSDRYSIHIYQFT